VIISKNGLELTKEFEGCKLVSYLDSGGVWTIGYGHTNGIKRYMECTQDQADEWLLSDIQSAQDDVNKLVKVSLTQNQFDALVSFTFNLGYWSLRRSTLLRILNSGNYLGAANEFSKWNRDNGMIVDGLVHRRAAEKLLFLSEENHV